VSFMSNNVSESKQVVCGHCHKINKVPTVRLADQPKCGACKQSLFQSKPIDLNEAIFSRHTQHSDIPVLVDFWASWCGPCKMMAPVLSQLAKESEPNLRIAKLETDQNQNISAQYNIRSIPTLALFKNGKEVARQAGAMSEVQLKQWLNSIL
jgi:thioredoxin 2